jgi:phenylacetate-CoA ligase
MAAFDRTHWMITREVERHLEVLETTQWLAPADVRALQDEKLRRLVRHAYDHAPFWRARLQAAKLRPDDVRGQDDLHKLPLLEKDEVRRFLHLGMLQEGVAHADILRITTSGSTGEPMVCYADRAQLELRWAATLRSQEWTGYRFGDPTVRLWHQTIGMTPGQVWKERADAVLANRTFIPVFSLTADLEPVVRTIERRRPVLIDGYAEALDLLARFIAARGGLAWQPRAVMSSAQTLTPASRAAIEAAFGCPVFDKYGSREFSGIAYESEAHDGHLVVAEGSIVEILVDGRPARRGEIGEVVVTDLNNLCMPFIRYRLGDLAEALHDPDERAPSPCGRGLPRIGAIHGRVQSILHGTDGRLVPGAFFGHALKDYEHALRRFQVVQDRPGAITLRIVKAPRYSDDTLDELKALIRRHLGDDLAIEVAVVDDIELVRTGKRAYAISSLPVDLQKGAPRIAPAGRT